MAFAWRCHVATALVVGCVALLSNAGSEEAFRFGAIIPKTSLITVNRAYHKRITSSLEGLTKGKSARFSAARRTAHQIVSLPLDPSPTEVLEALCDKLLPNDVVALLYFTNAEVYGSNAASAQYLLLLAGYLGLPVIAWNADNIGLEKNQRLPESQVLQLAPSVEHQSSAMLSILRRYSWHKFAIVTSRIGGHDDFVRAVRDQVLAITDFKFTIMDIYTLSARHQDEARLEMAALAGSEARVFLLYCNVEEAAHIMRAADALHLTGKNYVWIVTQSVVGPAIDNAPPDFPPGLLGIHFNTTMNRLMDEIERAIQIFVHGLGLYLDDPVNRNTTLRPGLNCTSDGDVKWPNGEHFFNYLRMVSIKGKGNRPDLEFNPDGTLRYVELEIMNLNNIGMWDKIGSWTEDGLDIKDIVWPGDSPVPPAGVPEKFNMKVTFMEEPPYVNIMHPDNETGECKTSRAVRCRVEQHSYHEGGGNLTDWHGGKQHMCCSGFCIDLLQKFANDLRFSYDLYRVEDGVWGVLQNNTWNGLIKEVLDGRADLVATSIKINAERQTALDFTVPFMETGIAIVVAKKTGIISPKAFLEPFDTTSWLMILLISIQVAALAIFLFEWLSPSGYDMKMLPPRGTEHRFSLFRTYWLVWAILFGAAVNVDCPRGYTARFMSNVWAMFAVVFLAIYTANLAAFMITREEFHDLTGIEDERLYNPWKTVPPFRYGTIPYGNTEAVLRTNKLKLYQYMKTFKKTTVLEGIKAVKRGELDAFVYDATVLEYLVGQDNECRLLTVGSWYAMTGYGFAMPKKSKYMSMFNKKMIEYRENGDIERLQRFWLQGVCKPQNQKRNASNPLDINQFMSAFLLLGCGVLLTLLLLGLEHIYFLYVRQHLAKKDDGGCFTLLSLSMGKSLSFRGAVFEAQDLIRHHRCKDPVCDTHLWKVKHELDMARIKIRKLENHVRSLAGKTAVVAVPSKDYTKNHVTTNEPIKNAPPLSTRHDLYRPSYTEIAEIETVL